MIPKYRGVSSGQSTTIIKKKKKNLFECSQQICFYGNSNVRKISSRSQIKSEISIRSSREKVGHPWCRYLQIYSVSFNINGVWEIYSTLYVQRRKLFCSLENRMWERKKGKRNSLSISRLPTRISEREKGTHPFIYSYPYLESFPSFSLVRRKTLPSLHCIHFLPPLNIPPYKFIFRTWYAHIGENVLIIIQRSPPTLFCVFGFFLNLSV